MYSFCCILIIACQCGSPLPLSRLRLYRVRRAFDFPCNMYCWKFFFLISSIILSLLRPVKRLPPPSPPHGHLLFYHGFVGAPNRERWFHIPHPGIIQRKKAHDYLYFCFLLYLERSP
jgi:hypothetical protein